MKKDPIDYGDEYAPDLHFSGEQIEELRSAGCDDELIKALAYHVGRIREENFEPTPALAIRRSLDKIEKHSRALLLEMQEGPPEVRHKLANTLYFGKLEIDGKEDGYHPVDDFKRALHAIWRAAHNDDRRRGKGSAGRREDKWAKVRVGDEIVADMLTLSLLHTVEHEGGIRVTTTSGGPADRIVCVCRQAAGLNPPDDLSRLLGPAVAAIAKRRK